MRTRTFSIALFTMVCTSAGIIAACSSSSDDTIAQPGLGDASTPDTGSPTAADAGVPSTDAAVPDTGSSGQSSVTFRYTPSWKGVTSVEVVGAFGNATDWTAPLLSLVNDGTGTFTGTTTLPNGQYLYVFKVTGDEAAAQPAKLARYALDPGNSAFAACPQQSPTFTSAAQNPCSQVTVPQPSADPTFHLRGAVQLGGSPVGGYFAEIERAEQGSHHFFVNRMTIGADGTFDLVAAPGSYRIQVLHPTYLAQNDTQRDPVALAAMRRAISTAVMLKADITMNPAEVAYGDYTAMTPRGDAGALPTTFDFTVLPHADAAHLAIYSPSTTIGDPWFLSPAAQKTSVTFDGGFNTKQAGDAGLQQGTRYWWGTEQEYAKPDGGVVSWTGQSMVFPVSWP